MLPLLTPTPPNVSAIIPARNEQPVIAACLRSLLPQSALLEILVIDDHSSDGTSNAVEALLPSAPNLKLIHASDPPSGWVGKNNAVALGARQACGEWLLFTDADTIHGPNSVQAGLQLAASHHAALVSFSPEQITKSWYEKALIPFVYTRLSRRFSFAHVNDPANPQAAANGQYLLIRRDAYDAIGGHARVAGDVLEDVAIARLAKAAGFPIWFTSGAGILQVRMYRNFRSLWQGWKKNLYRLMGGNLDGLILETLQTLLPLMTLLLIAAILASIVGGSRLTLLAFLAAVIAWFVHYAVALRQSGQPLRNVAYGPLGLILYVAVLWASFRSYQKGSVSWKGRAYPVNTSDASKR